MSGADRLERADFERWELQRANLVERVLGWERAAEEKLQEAGRLTPVRRGTAEASSERARRREVLLEGASRLREAAADVRLILDLPLTSVLRDPLYRDPLG